MAKDKKKIKRKRRLFAIIIAVTFGGIIVQQQITMNKLNQSYDRYKDQLEALTANNEELTYKKELTQRQDYTEHVARETLGLVKPGEILFIDKNKKK